MRKMLRAFAAEKRHMAQQRYSVDDTAEPGTVHKYTQDQWSAN